MRDIKLTNVYKNRQGSPVVVESDNGHEFYVRFLTSDTRYTVNKEGYFYSTASEHPLDLVEELSKEIGL